MSPDAFGDDVALKTGKLPGELLQQLIDGLPRATPADKRLVVGPGVGEDAAHILFGATTLLAKTDPITFATDRIGWYAVNVNANDIAVAGGTPKWFMATLMMPPESTVGETRAIFGQLGDAAAAIGVQLVGGHTEVTAAVSQPVICGFMLGEAPTSRTVSASGATPGDAVILTKSIAIEGTAILARECRPELLANGIPASDVDAAANLLDDPGISIFRDAQIATAAGDVTAMHDPTEGGLATALQELAFASDVNIAVDFDAVPTLPVTAAICDTLELDAWGLISSGALLATVTADTGAAVIAALHDADIPARVVGTVEARAETDGGPRVFRASPADGAARVPIPTFERDELARYFDRID